MPHWQKGALQQQPPLLSPAAAPRSRLQHLLGSLGPGSAPAAAAVPPSPPQDSGAAAGAGQRAQRQPQQRAETRGMAGGGGLRRLLLLLGGLLCLGRWAPLAAAPQGRPGRGPPPSPCQAPLQWEGRTVAYDHSSGRNTRAAVSYDGSKQRLRVLEERKGLIPCKKFFEYIFLYQDAVMFQIEQVTKLCSKIALTEPWDPYDIPDNSTYEDQYYIGGPGDEIVVQEWSDRKPARKFESWVGVYTVKDCYPVQETYTKNYSVTTSTRFFDLQLGITDPSVFIPPSTCQEAQPVKMKDEC